MLLRGTNLAAEHTMAYEHLPLLASLLGLFTLGPVACQPATAPHPSAAPGEAVADDASHGTPTRGDDSPQATAAEAPDGEALAGVWVDPDALPAGARVRLGTKAFQRGDGLAVADDGRVATLDRDFNALVETRPSSDVRRTKIPEGARCQELRYVGARLLCLQQSPPARVWAEGGRARVEPLPCEKGVVTGSHDATWFACVDDNREGAVVVTVIDARTGDDVVETTALQGTLSAYDDRVRIDAEGRVALALEARSEGGKPRLVGLHKGSISWDVEGRYEFIAAVHGKARFLAYSREADTITSINSKTGKRSTAHALKPKHTIVRPIHVAPDGQTWFGLSMYGDFTLHQFKVGTHAPVGSWPVRGVPAQLAISPSGNHVAVDGDRIERSVTSASVPKLPSAAAFTGLARSPDGARIAWTRYDQTVAVGDAKNGEILVQAKGPEAGLRAVPLVFSPDGKSIAVGNHYGDLRILDARTLEQRCSAQVSVSSLFWGPGGIVAVDLGNPADDEQFFPGHFTHLNERCEVRKEVPHDSLVGVVDVRSDYVDLALLNHDWEVTRTSKIVRVDLRRGKASPAPASARRLALKLQDEMGNNVPPRPRLSDDATTRLEHFLPSEDEYDQSTRSVRCVDAKTGDVLQTHALPPSTWWGEWDSILFAPDGRWFSIPDGPSLLIYACRG